MKGNIMGMILVILISFINTSLYAQETGANGNWVDENYDFGTAEGVTVYGERKEYDSNSTEAYILNQLNGTASDRKRFIEADFLEKAGFRRTGNVKYRKTESSEKAISILHGVIHPFSFGLVPLKPFLEIDYDRLPKGESYKFESVIIKSQFKSASPEVLTVMELEYMFQIELCYGIILPDNINNFNEQNINKFERLILSLPDYPAGVMQIKKRFLNELSKIKDRLERSKNLSGNNLRAKENLKDSFN